ncbi:hypothetical protein ILYODFUR_007526, partial [Ilyodon furcidens]
LQMNKKPVITNYSRCSVSLLVRCVKCKDKKQMLCSELLENTENLIISLVLLTKLPKKYMKLYLRRLLKKDAQPLFLACFTLPHPTMQQKPGNRKVFGPSLQHTPGRCVQLRLDNICTTKEPLYSSFGTIPRPPPPNDLVIVVLVRTLVRMLCLHLHK